MKNICIWILRRQAVYWKWWQGKDIIFQKIYFQSSKLGILLASAKLWFCQIIPYYFSVSASNGNSWHSLLSPKKKLKLFFWKREHSDRLLWLCCIDLPPLSRTSCTHAANIYEELLKLHRKTTTTNTKYIAHQRKKSKQKDLEVFQLSSFAIDLIAWAEIRHSHAASHSSARPTIYAS